MEIDKKLLLQFMGSVSMFKSQAEDIVKAYECGEYSDSEDLEEDLNSLERRYKNTDKIQKEIYDKYFK